MTTDGIMDRIRNCGLVPAMAIEEEETAVPVAEALLAGGVDVIEIMFRSPAAEASIRRISEACPEMLVGAGTLLTEIRWNVRWKRVHPLAYRPVSIRTL